MQSEPHVSRHGLKRSVSRTPSYQNFADDESSDSSGGSGLIEGYGIQGSFPSNDYMRVRWATPMKAADVAETSDGRRRVGIKDVTGNMTCVVLDRRKSKTRGRISGDSEEGLVMKVEYTGTCRGIWFPGVATMLGMDVKLDAGDCDVTWVPGEERKWTVIGGSGYTGFAVGPPPPASRKSADAPPIYIMPSTPNGKTESKSSDDNQRWAGSSASLLRAPLPSGTDDSFSDVSPHNTPLSSIASLTTIPSSPERRSRANSGANLQAEEEPVRSPKVPLSIHLNMNELVPPQKNSFTFTISGTILVKPPSGNALQKRFFQESSGSDSDDESHPVVLPRFSVLYAERESNSTTVRNQLDDCTLGVHNVQGNLSDPQSLLTVLQPGNQTKCGSDGARLVVKRISEQSMYTHRPRRDESPETTVRRPSSRPRTPNGFLQRTPSSASLRQTYVFASPKPKRDGELMIPKVTATVDILPAGYDVEVSLLAPTDTDSEWLEFSLAHPPSGEDKRGTQPVIQVASATIDGVPVRFETTVSERPSAKVPALGFPVDESISQEMMTWVKVHVGEAGGGKVEVTYSVLTEALESISAPQNRKGKAVEPTPLDILLPSFGLRVGRLEVHIPDRSGMLFTLCIIDSMTDEIVYLDVDISVTSSNFEPPQKSPQGVITLVARRLEEFFTPQVKIGILPAPALDPPGGLSRWWAVMAIASAFVALLAVAGQQGMANELAQTKLAVAEYSSLAAFVPEPATVTITSTTYVSTTLYATVTVTERTIEPSSAAATESILSSSTTLRTKISQASAAPTLTSTVPTITPSPAASSTDAVSPIRDLPFLWPIHFDIPPVDLPVAARATADAIMRGLGFAWQLCRKVYHYPLDPP